MASFEEQLTWLSTRIERLQRQLGAMQGSLATASTWQRIHGAILVPDSIGTSVIAPDAITETEIDDDSISTPKLQANAVTAAKLEANLVLSGRIIGGAFSDPDVHGVELSSAGLKLFNGAAVQRGLLSSDGSGWFGTSTGFTWDTAGAITATGITVRSAATGAKVQLTTAGLRMLNASDQIIWELTSSGQKWWNSTGSTQRGQILNDGSGWIGTSTQFAWDASGNVTATGITLQSASTTAKARLNSSGLQLFNSSGVQTVDLNTNGSGFLGSGTPAISWGTGGTATINASAITTGTLNASSITVTNLSASSITAGTLVADRISGGSLGGGFNLGSSNLTVNGTGQVRFGNGDYLGSSILHFDTGSSASARVEFRQSSNTYYGQLLGYSGSSSGGAILNALSSSNGNIFSNFDAVAGSSLSQAIMRAHNSSGNARFSVNGGGSGRYHLWEIDSGSIMSLTSSKLFVDTELEIGSGHQIDFVSPGTGGSASNWSSFTVANIPDKSAGYLHIRIAGNLYRVPFYANG